MKVLYAAAAVGLALLGSVGSVSAQPYGGRGYGGDGYDGGGYGGRRGYGGGGFDEDEYLRCNPDVRRAVRRGQMRSGAAHFREYGRREHRRLSC